jgi:predicted Zn-dependent protease|tara:strand:- start:6893 stop:7708 length:816 start_codon:yes stop_codon:yes gene_type:complete
MKKNRRLAAKGFGMILLMGVMLSACKDKPGGGGLNFFSLQDDITFGAQVAAEIENDPSTYPILDSAQNVAAYAFLYDIRDRILNSGNVVHKDDFQWQLRLIGDDSTLNAFCTPGGYIYVYTGLIKYLDSEDQFAGVMGHEIAHADERHSTAALTRTYGIDVLLSILLGDNQGTLTQIAKGLSSLSYSRGNESESDMRSVEYLYPTEYDARGAARFFEKLEAQGGASGPQFLSTHPNPENRVEAIFAHWESLGGKVGETFEARYKEFQNNLP